MKHHDTRNTPCRQIRLAQSGMGEICICPDCGVVHVAMQYFSMRFELEAFRILQAMLGEAQSKIEQQQGATVQKAPDALAMQDVDGAPKAILH